MNKDNIKTEIIVKDQIINVQELIIKNLYQLLT